MFKNYHPAVNLIFFSFVIGLSMFSTNPYFIGAALISAWAYSAVLKGRKAFKTNFILMIPIVIFMAVINTLFTHNGETVLFYLNASRITLEALIFGIVGAFLLSTVLIWFTVFSEIMSSEKLIYIFGKARPVLGLTFSMIFRFIPLLKERFREIHMGQQCMGRGEEETFVGKIRQFTREVSILISWSLEAAIETSDSMEARGYGLPGRTSFHIFKMTPKDYKLLAEIIILGGFVVTCGFLGELKITFYPEFVVPDWTILRIIALICFTILCFIPIFLDKKEERKWQLLKSKI